MAFNNFSTAVFVAASFAALALSPTANAQLYKWTDENGKVHYSDTVPPAANDRARREIRSDGVVTKQIDRAMTPEERRAAAVRAADEEKGRIAKEERERKDKALLVTYASLADFDRVRDRALAAVDAELVAVTNRVDTLNARKSSVTKEIGLAGKKVPLKLTKELDDLEAEITDGTALQTKRVRDRSQMVSNYQQERIRLANLISEQAATDAAAAGSAKQSQPTATAATKKK
jgi:Domain of unknown function (DUF4124)